MIDIQQKPVISNHITVSVMGVSILCGCIFSRFSRSYINFIFVSYISQYLCLPQYFWLFQVLEAFRLAMLIIMAQMFVIIRKKLISRVSGSDLHLAWFVDEF